jgi:hypothetical protein
LSQLIECRLPAGEQSPGVCRRLDALWVAIEQTDRKHVLKSGDNIRNGGLGEPEPGCCFGHAAGLHDGKKDLKVPKPETAADMLYRTSL